MNYDYRTKEGKEVLRIRREAVAAYKRILVAQITKESK